MTDRRGQIKERFSAPPGISRTARFPRAPSESEAIWSLYPLQSLQSRTNVFALKPEVPRLRIRFSPRHGVC